MLGRIRAFEAKIQFIKERYHRRYRIRDIMALYIALGLNEENFSYGNNNIFIPELVLIICDILYGSLIAEFLQEVVDGNLDETKNMLNKYPGLIFETATVLSPSGCIIEDISAFEIAIGTCDAEMFELLQDYFPKRLFNQVNPDTEKSESSMFVINYLHKYKKSLEQLLVQSPDKLYTAVYEKVDYLSSYDFTPLINCINNSSDEELDEALNCNLLSKSELQEALIKFRDEVTVKTIKNPCMHYDYQTLYHALKLFKKNIVPYIDNENPWNEKQAKVFLILVIGFLQRGLTGYCRMAFSQLNTNILASAKQKKRSELLSFTRSTLFASKTLQIGNKFPITTLNILSKEEIGKHELGYQFAMDFGTLINRPLLGLVEIMRKNFKILFELLCFNAGYMRRMLDWSINNLIKDIKEVLPNEFQKEDLDRLEKELREIDIAEAELKIICKQFENLISSNLPNEIDVDECDQYIMDLNNYIVNTLKFKYEKEQVLKNLDDDIEQLDELLQNNVINPDDDFEKSYNRIKDIRKELATLIITLAEKIGNLKQTQQKVNALINLFKQKKIDALILGQYNKSLSM